MAELNQRKTEWQKLQNMLRNQVLPTSLEILELRLEFAHGSLHLLPRIETLRSHWTFPWL
jgi:hypothetical protein